MFVYFLEGPNEQLREGASKIREKEKRGRTVQTLTTRARRTTNERTTDLLCQTTSIDDLRDLHLCTTCDNNALVLVDQVGL